MSDHDHREYASDRHDHNEYADEYHRHYDLEREDDRQQQEIRELREALSQLSGELASAWTRIGSLEEKLTAEIEAHRENEPHLHADGSTS
jgi:septal ring factor EnvC (AmiA/AmiB activator)